MGKLTAAERAKVFRSRKANDLDFKNKEKQRHAQFREKIKKSKNKRELIKKQMCIRSARYRLKKDRCANRGAEDTIQ